MRRFSILAVFLLLLVFVSPATAATKPKTVAKSALIVSAQYVKSRNYVKLFFADFKGVSKITYTLMYEGNGMEQGVEGGFTVGKRKNFSQNLYLGTCSSGTCMAKNKIKNIRVQVVTKYTNGKSSTKTYKVK